MASSEVVCALSSASAKIESTNTSLALTRVSVVAPIAVASTRTSALMAILMNKVTMVASLSSSWPLRSRTLPLMALSPSRAIDALSAESLSDAIAVAMTRAIDRPGNSTVTDLLSRPLICSADCSLLRVRL